MSYSKVGIQKLSKNQVSKLLRGISTRIKSGSAHQIHLSEEHSKKLNRAHRKNAGITIQLDPYAIQHNNHLRHDVGMRGKGTGTDLGHIMGHVAGESAEAAGTRLVSAIAGTDTSGNQDQYDYSMNEEPVVGEGVNRLHKAKRWANAVHQGYQGVAHAVKPLAKPIIQAITERVVEEISNPSNMMGMGAKKKRGRPSKKMHGGLVDDTGAYDRPPNKFHQATPAETQAYMDAKKKRGGSVNRLKKAERWTGFLGDMYQGVAHAVKPVALPIFQAGTNRIVGYVDPQTPQDYLNNSIGMGIKRRGRPRKGGSMTGF